MPTSSVWLPMQAERKVRLSTLTDSFHRRSNNRSPLTGRLPRHDHVLRAKLPILDILQELKHLSPTPLHVGARDAGFSPKPAVIPLVVFISEFTAVIGCQGRIRIEE